jgi:hypothetical protein
MSASCRRPDDQRCPVTDARKRIPDVNTTAAARPPADIDPATLVRRALLASATELETALASATATDRRRQKALDRWFAGFASQVRRHHELLDGVVVPTLTARGGLDEQALDRLADDHSWIDELLSDLGDALGVLSFGLGAESFWLGKASDLAATLRHVLQAQLAREEALLTPAIARFLDGDEREIVADETVRAVATGPVRFSLAWLYTHISDEERAVVDPHASAAGRLVGRTGRGAYERAAVAALG